MNFLETAIYRIILKTYVYMQETGRTESFERFPYLRVLTGRLTEEALEQWQQDNGVQAVRYYSLISRMNGADSQDKEDGLESDILCNVLDRVLKLLHGQYCDHSACRRDRRHSICGLFRHDAVAV